MCTALKGPLTTVPVFPGVAVVPGLRLLHGSHLQPHFLMSVGRLLRRGGLSGVPVPYTLVSDPGVVPGSSSMGFISGQSFSINGRYSLALSRPRASANITPRPRCGTCTTVSCEIQGLSTSSDYSSHWTSMVYAAQCVRGSLKPTEPNIFPVKETPWIHTCAHHHPNPRWEQRKSKERRRMVQGVGGRKQEITFMCSVFSTTILSVCPARPCVLGLCYTFLTQENEIVSEFVPICNLETSEKSNYTI